MLKKVKLRSLGVKMLQNAENTVLSNLQFLYTFVLREEICTTFEPKMVTNTVIKFLPHSISVKLCKQIAPYKSTFAHSFHFKIRESVKCAYFI